MKLLLFTPPPPASTALRSYRARFSLNTPQLTVDVCMLVDVTRQDTLKGVSRRLAITADDFDTATRVLI